MVCQWCGNTFTAQKSNTRYCSKRCADLANKQRMREMTQAIVDGNNEIKKSKMPHSEEVMTPVLLAEYLGVCRNTVYNYLQCGMFPSIKAKGKTFVRRTDVDKVFDSAPPYQKQAPKDAAVSDSPTTTSTGSIKGGRSANDERYTTVKEVAERYDLSLAGTDKILKESGITVIKHKGKHYYYLHEVEALFRKREADNHPEISEWYTSADIQEKFKLKPATIWDIASSYGIPTKRVHRVTYYSKIHFDMARGIKPPETELWYTVSEAMEKFHQSRDQVYSVLRYNNIHRVQVGRIVKFRRSEYDKAMKFITTSEDE